VPEASRLDQVNAVLAARGAPVTFAVTIVNVASAKPRWPNS
jgi:hypothetical protein